MSSEFKEIKTVPRYKMFYGLSARMSLHVNNKPEIYLEMSQCFRFIEVLN